MANIYSLQLLRNGNPYSSYAEAVAGIKAATTTDGTIKLARYYQAGASGNTKADKYNTNGEIKTIFGIYNVLLGEKAAGYTIFDATHEVLENIQAQIDSITGEGGSVAEQIKAAIDQLNYTGVTTGDGVVVTNVIQESGVVSADSAEVGGLKLTNYALGSDSGAVAANDTINEAISKLQNQVNKANEDAEEAIKALDAEINAADGYVIDHIEQVDGKISGTTRALPSLDEVASDGQAITSVSQTNGAVNAAYGDVAAAHVTVADAGNLFSSTTVEATLAEIVDKYTAADTALKTEILGGASASADTLGELETLINNVSNAAKSYSITAVTGSELINLGTTVKEAYKLVDEDGTKAGDYIKIYKDQTLKSAEYSGQSLVLTYILADGSESAVSIDMHDLIEQTEFASGVTWDATASKVRGVVDSTSETFLTVGADGFKLTGVQAAIDNAVSSASTDLQGALDSLSGKAVTTIASVDGSVTATPSEAADGTVAYDLSTDASKVKVSSAYAPVINAPIATGDTLDVALAKLEAQANAANASVQKDANATHLTVTTRTGLNNETIYTIGENDIASKTDLDAEIAARKAVDGQSGQTYAANAGTNYISGASSLNDADVKLDAAIKALEGAAQTEIDAIEAAVGLDANGNHITSTGNYTRGADSIEGEIVALDAQVKTNADNIAELSGKTITGITMNGTGVTVNNNVAAMTASYTNTAANSTDGMVITTGNDGGLEFQFGTLDCGNYD